MADLWHRPLVCVDNLKQFFKMFSNVLQLFRLFLFLFPPLLLLLPLRNLVRLPLWQWQISRQKLQQKTSFLSCLTASCD